MPCTTRPDTSYFYTGDGDLTDSCPFEACVDNCGIGKFLDECGTANTTSENGFGNSRGVCSNCTSKTSAQYYTSSGGLNNECSTADCDVASCYSGQYVSFWRTFARVHVLQPRAIVLIVLFVCARRRRYLQNCGVLPIDPIADHENFAGVCSNCSNKPAPNVEVISTNTRCASEYVEVTTAVLDECAIACFDENAECAVFSYNTGTQVCRFSQCGENTGGDCQVRRVIMYSVRRASISTIIACLAKLHQVAHPEIYWRDRHPGNAELKPQLPTLCTRLLARSCR